MSAVVRIKHITSGSKSLPLVAGTRKKRAPFTLFVRCNMNKKIIVSLALGMIFGAIISYLLLEEMFEEKETKLTAQNKLLFDSYSKSIPIREIDIQIGLVSLVENENYNEYFRKSCLFIKGKHRSVKAISKSDEFYEHEVDILKRAEKLIKVYEEKKLCFYKDGTPNKSLKNGTPESGAP